MKSSALAVVCLALLTHAAAAQTVAWSAVGDVYTLSLNLPNNTDYNWLAAEMIVDPTVGSIDPTGPNYAFDMVTPGATYVAGPRPVDLDGAGRDFSDGGSQFLTPNMAKPTFDGQFTAGRVSVAWLDIHNGTDADAAGPHTLAQITLSTAGEATVTGTAFIYDIPNTTLIALSLGTTLQPAAPSISIVSYASAALHGSLGLQTLPMPASPPYLIEPRRVLNSGFSIHIVTDSTLADTTATFVLRGNAGTDNTTDFTQPNAAITRSLATTSIANDTLVLTFTPGQATRYRLTVSDINGSPIAANNERLFSLLVGDADSNETVNFADLFQINGWITTPTFDARGDINLSGALTAADLAAANVRVGNSIAAVVFPTP